MPEGSEFQTEGAATLKLAREANVIWTRVTDNRLVLECVNSTASGIDVAGTMVQFGDAVKLLGVDHAGLWSHAGSSRDAGCACLQLPHACPASHPTTSDV